MKALKTKLSAFTMTNKLTQYDLVKFWLTCELTAHAYCPASSDIADSS